VISTFVFYQKTSENIETSEISSQIKILNNGSEINSLTMKNFPYQSVEFDDFSSFAVDTFPIVVVLSMIFSVKVLMTVRIFWICSQILRLCPKT